MYNTSPNKSISNITSPFPFYITIQQMTSKTLLKSITTLKTKSSISKRK